MLFRSQYVLERVSYALEDTRTPFIARLCFFPLSLLYLFAASKFPPEHIILAIIAFTAILNTVYAALWVWIIRRKIGPFGIKYIALRHLLFAGLSLISGAAGAGVMWLLGGYSDGWSHINVTTTFLACAIVGIVMAAVYFGALFLLRDPDLRAVTDKLMARFGRRGGSAPAE